MNTLCREAIADGVNFSSVKDTRFKTMRISATALLELDADTVSGYALLSQILTRSCREYPDFTVLSKKLSSLYGASLEAEIRKLGEVLALTFSVSGIDDRYSLKGESISEELSRILCSVIFDPLMINGHFDEDAVAQEKRQLIEYIDSEFNDKRVYANKRLTELMCSDEAFSVARYGTREQVEQVTMDELNDAFDTMLKRARFEIFFIGESSSETAKQVFMNKFSALSREPYELKTQIVRSADTVREFTDRMDVSQAKLLMGFRTDCACPDDDVIAMRLMCAVLGGSANSKFFRNVREKQSLCYYCVSRFNRLKGIISVESGVEDDNIEKTKNAVLAELEAIKNGDVTDDEIMYAKLSIANSFVGICDTVYGIYELYFSQLFDGRFLSAEESIAEFNSVTKDQVIEAARKLTLDTVYVLRKKEED